ncbi:TadE family protein [Pseudodesulfovibrio sp. zrk46]|uniref:TadE/TadG family type IV pilus assembly protein n=1 Tax=Pseudodesulfovibrio sp. zrk46 TaxID=2725288 RepID=UPI001448B674|nr:TadE family protein [Pseudodesulfovibrio sp. zrk46]QJB55004.1 pilus assembly protein [Pseudodesulfovibrio sp. zrk46]
MRRDTEGRQGATIAEFAFTLALLMAPLFAGVWDVSKFIDINQVLTRAARDGVVAASRGEDPTAMIKDYVAAAGLFPEDLIISIVQGPEQPGLGEEVSVQLAYDFSGYTIFPWEDFLPNGLTTSAYAKME